jgi:hypothetical protein
MSEGSRIGRLGRRLPSRATRRPSRSRAGWLRQRMSRDDGTTLIELMVGMMLMTVFMAMFTGAVVMMNNAMNKSQEVNLTASQLNVAFQNVDSIVRYAAAISTPGVGTSGDWYVELRTTYTGTQVCTQLRVGITSQQLQRRTWSVNAVASKPTNWTPISSGISNGGAAGGPATQPFYLKAPLPTAQSQQLTVNLIAQSGSGRSFTNSTASFTLTAVNSTVPPPTSPICQEQGRP